MRDDLREVAVEGSEPATEDVPVLFTELPVAATPAQFQQWLDATVPAAYELDVITDDDDEHHLRALLTSATHGARTDDAWARVAFMVGPDLRFAVFDIVSWEPSTLSDEDEADAIVRDWIGMEPDPGLGYVSYRHETETGTASVRFHLVDADPSDPTSSERPLYWIGGLSTARDAGSAPIGLAAVTATADLEVLLVSLDTIAHYLTGREILSLLHTE